VVGEKAVGELGEGVGVEQRRADRPEFASGEDAAVDERLLDHRQPQPAGVDDAVAEGDRQHDANPVAPV
jgi:hypothetical protein